MIPRHIVLFPDGNGRWAKKNNLPALAGYKKGYQNLLDFSEWCKNRGVKVLTVYGFTTENWDRGQAVVNFLMNLFEKLLAQNLEKYLKTDEWQKMGVRIKVIGQKEKFSKNLQQEIEKLEEATKNNKKLFLNLCVSYGGKWDILQAVKKIASEKIPAEKINEKLFSKYLSMGDLPDPDFIIRAGGHIRLSNFGLWQSAYSELYFSPKFWPEFTEQDLDIALAEFNKRSRRFG
jgi:undecaprenyl diphosphate synthase